MNIKTIGTLALMAAMVTGTAARAYTVTVSDTLLADNHIFDNCVGESTCSTALGLFDMIGNPIVASGVSVPDQYLAPSPTGAYAAAHANDVVLHASSELTSIEFNWGSWDYQPITGSGTNIFEAGHTVITGAAIAGAFQFEGQRNVSIIISGLDPFNVATWSDFPTSTFEFNSVGVPSAAAPEASTWAMMLVGFVGLGYAARRRGRAVAA